MGRAFYGIPDQKQLSSIRAGSEHRCVIIVLVLGSVCCEAARRSEQLMLSTRGRSKTNCRDPGSNRGPSDLQSDALPTELSRPYCKQLRTERLRLDNLRSVLHALPCSFPAASNQHPNISRQHHTVRRTSHLQTAGDIGLVALGSFSG